MKTLTFDKETIKFPIDPIYIRNYFETQLNRKYNYDTCKYLFMWSTLAEKYAEDKVYQKNFWKSLKTVINKEYRTLAFPTDFKEDLLKMKEIKEKYSEDKKLYNKEHKLEIEKEKNNWKENYGFALVDGEKIEVGNTLIESSRIFIGRGNNEFRGAIVDDVKEKDITINTSDKNFKLGDCKIEFKPDTMSIATYTEHLIGFDFTINKAIWFSTKSEFKADNDEYKFEKARLLYLHINKVNKAIKEMCLSTNPKERQIGCCAYLISKFGIRAGNEDKRNNGVVGASTLSIDNIELWTDKQSIHLKFVGKDSIPYNNSLKVDEWVFKPFWDCMVKEDSLVRNCKERLFPDITSSDVNEFLQSICKDIPDLSGKVFRTMFGTSLLVKEIQNADWEGLTDKQFKNKYDSCVLTVAKKLNHQKTVSKESSEKLDKSTKEKMQNAKNKLNLTKTKTEEKLLKLSNDKIKAKNRGDKSKVKQITENEKLLKEKLEIAKKVFEETKEQLKFKSDNKEIALNTSKLNYSDSKVAFSLCKTYDKDPILIYGKSAKERFEVWCSDVDKDYWKNYPNV